jgi:hypothetical protein
MLEQIGIDVAAVTTSFKATQSDSSTILTSCPFSLASFAAKEASCPTGPALVAIFRGSSANAVPVSASERPAACARRKSILIFQVRFLLKLPTGQ